MLFVSHSDAGPELQASTEVDFVWRVEIRSDVASETKVNAAIYLSKRIVTADSAQEIEIMVKVCEGSLSFRYRGFSCFYTFLHVKIRGPHHIIFQGLNQATTTLLSFGLKR
jgi:hypothetical protein